MKKPMTATPGFPGTPAPRAFPFFPCLFLFLAGLLLLSPVLSTPAAAPADAAYGPATTKRMTDLTLRLAPVALRNALLAYRSDLDRGVSDALKGYAAKPTADVLDAAVREFDLVPTLFQTMEPFQQVAYHMGMTAGLIYLLNDPLRAGRDPRAVQVQGDYLAYMERKLPLIVVAFDGYDSPPLRGDLRSYLIHRLDGMPRYEQAVLFCYFPHGKRVSSDTFDDRSNAFGVAEVVLSHAVSDAAKSWFYMWKSMGGDVAATPFYHPGENHAS
ncbi:MAG: hypothetical protein ACP5VF_08075 [Acidobacteriota bacterium]